MDITKTCTNVGTEYEDVDQFICSRCGILLQEWVMLDENGDAHEFSMRFCPNCGAKINVEGEAAE